MNKIFTTFIALFLFSTTLNAQEVVELYNKLGVEFTRDITFSPDSNGMSVLGYYQTTDDKIHLLKKGQFHNKGAFNHTALHELGHWARQKDRLGPIGGIHYYPDCFEEITVDIAAMIMADSLGLPREHPNTISIYIKQQLAGRKLKSQHIKLIRTEIAKTIQYLLKEEVSPDHINKYFKAVHLTA